MSGPNQFRIPTAKSMIGTIRTKVSSGGFESPYLGVFIPSAENSEVDVDFVTAELRIVVQRPLIN